ncbi:MAG: YdcF family protein [Oscillospiraceae bacterium]|jgi:vancomycin permeability regulator SanA|nr:YdcF family protein [Oscillospiraceae bacterium]
MVARSTKRKRRNRRRVFGSFVALLALFGLVFGAMNVWVYRESQDRILPEATAIEPDAEKREALGLTDIDAILVLGSLAENGVPSAVLEDRINCAVKLYEAKLAPVLLMSGNSTRAAGNEPKVMKQAAVNQLVPSKDIFMDHWGLTTYESLVRARDVFGVKRVLIVSQRYHLFRAVYLAKQLGLEAWGVASDYRVYEEQNMMSAREFLARGKAFVWGFAKPDPTFGGEPIPLKYSGDVTNDPVNVPFTQVS